MAVTNTKSKPTAQRAFSTADRVHLTVLNSDSEEVFSTIVEPAAIAQGDETIVPVDVSLQVPIGTGYALYVEIFNLHESATEPIVTGSSDPFDVIPDQATDISVICMPVNPMELVIDQAVDVTQVTTVTDENRAFLEPGGEKWFHLSLPENCAVEIEVDVPVEEETGREFYCYAVFDEYGRFTDRAGVNTLGENGWIALPWESQDVYLVVLLMDDGEKRDFIVTVRETSVITGAITVPGYTSEADLVQGGKENGIIFSDHYGGVGLWLGGFDTPDVVDDSLQFEYVIPYDGDETAVIYGGFFQDSGNWPQVGDVIGAYDPDPSTPIDYATESGLEPIHFIGNVSGVDFELLLFNPNPVTGITLFQYQANLFLGDQLQLEAFIEPSDAFTLDVSWSTSDDTVVTVDADGLVTAIAAGTVVITATSGDGGFTAECEVTVDTDQALFGTWLHHYGNVSMLDTTLIYEIASDSIIVTMQTTETGVTTSAQANVEVIDQDARTMTVHWITADGHLDYLDGKYQRIDWRGVSATKATLTCYNPDDSIADAQAQTETADVMGLFTDAQYEQPELSTSFYFLGKQAVVLGFELAMASDTLGEPANYLVRIGDGSSVNPTSVAVGTAKYTDDTVTLYFSNLPPLESGDELQVTISPSVVSADGVSVHPAWRSLSEFFLVDLDAAGFGPWLITYDDPVPGAASVGAVNADPATDLIFHDDFTIDSGDNVMALAYEGANPDGPFLGFTVWPPAVGSLSQPWDQPMGQFYGHAGNSVSFDPAQTYRFSLAYFDYNNRRRDAVVYLTDPVVYLGP